MRTGRQWPEGRGEGISEEKGEGFVETIIKDTWTVTERGVETGGRWEGLGVRGGGEQIIVFEQ